MKTPNRRFTRRSPPLPWSQPLGAMMAATLLLVSLLGCGSETRPPNIVLITMDTTRPDHLGAYGYPAAHTPNLDRFADQSSVYENAYSTSSWTLPAHASMFTGLLPRQHGAQSVPKGPNKSLGYGVRPLSDSFTTLAEILGQAGYRTGAVVAGPALRSELGTAQGFEIYQDELDGPLRIYNGKRAEETTDLALEVLKDFGNDPFFLFVNYFDPHAPYAPPKDFDSPIRTRGDTDGVQDSEPGKQQEPPNIQDTPLVKLYLETLTQGAVPRSRSTYPPEQLAEIERVLSGYDAEIAYMDLHLGRLLAAIDRLPRGEDTWIIITSDHGESFGEHYFTSHGAHLYEDNVRVPLMVRPPGGGKNQRTSQAVQTHRLFGSILEIAGQPRPDWAVPITETREQDEILLEVHRSETNVLFGGDFFDRDLFSLLAPPFKLIHSSNNEIELFNLSDDPEELQNLYPEQRERAQRMGEKLSGLQTEYPPLYSEPESRELRKETEEALRAMGYIE